MASNISNRTRWAVGLALISTVGAMAEYPGGTPRDPSTVGYAFARNFLSDLGMTVAYNHQPNQLGARLFTLSVLLLVIGLGHAAVVVSRHLAVHAAARRWARAAAVFGLLACVAFAGVAVTPENRVMAVHVAFTLWAWRITPVIAALLAVASFHAPGVRRRFAMAWVVVTAILAAYAALLSWGPSLMTADGLVVQVVAQKVAVVVLIGTLLFAARETDTGRFSE